MNQFVERLDQVRRQSHQRVAIQPILKTMLGSQLETRGFLPQLFRQTTQFVRRARQLLALRARRLRALVHLRHRGADLRERSGLLFACGGNLADQVFDLDHILHDFAQRAAGLARDLDAFLRASPGIFDQFRR